MLKMSCVLACALCGGRVGDWQKVESWNSVLEGSLVHLLEADFFSSFCEDCPFVATLARRKEEIPWNKNVAFSFPRLSLWRLPVI
jgi:hypothetical protein